MNEKIRPNAAQKLVAASAFVLFGGACASPINEQARTPQPIPTPSGSVWQSCEPFTVPDWTAHKTIEYACPEIAGDPESRVNVILREQKDGALSISTSKFKVEGNEAELEKEVKVQGSLPIGKFRSFQSPIDPNCAITINNATSKAPDVSIACTK